MKKLVSLLVAALLVLNSVFAVGIFAADEAPQEYVMNEDFSSGDLSQWVISPNDKGAGSYGEVAADPDDPNNKVLKVISPDKFSAAINFEEPLKGIYVFEYRFWYDTTEGVLHHMGEFNNDLGENCWQFMTYQGNYIVKNGGMANDRNYSVPNMSTIANEWHTVQYVLDTDNGVYNMTLDGMEFAKNFEFGIPVDCSGGISSMFWTVKGTYLIDDLKIYQQQAAKINYGRVKSDFYTVDTKALTIDDVEYETSIEDFYSYLVFEEGAQYEVVKADGSAKDKDYMEDGDKLIVQAQDGADRTEYTVFVKMWDASLQLNTIARNSIMLYVGSSDALLKNEKVKIDPDNPEIMPTIINDRTLVPVRFISEGFGAQVGWDGDNGVVTIDTGNTTVTMTLGSQTINIGGTDQEIDVAPQIIGDRTFIPLRAAAEAIGKKVFWDPRGLIVIGDEENPFNTLTRQPWIEEILARFDVKSHTNFDMSLVPEAEQAGAEFYVATDGDDANDGSEAAPFATLKAARDAVRKLKSGSGLPEGGVNIYVRGSKYIMDSTFELTEQDSGTETAPVRYLNYPGEQPQFSGSVTLDPNNFKKVSGKSILDRLQGDAKDNVYEYDLKTLGLTSFDNLEWIGMGQPYELAPNALSFNGNELTVARWPNEGFVKTGRVYDPGSSPRNNEKPDRGFTFEYTDDRIESYQDITDVWMLGYWALGYCESTTSIASIDTEQKTITTTYPSRYRVSAGKPYYYYNVLEELDIPGEYYLDRKNAKLYVYPSEELEGADIQFTTFENDMVSLNKASNIVLRGLTLESSRKNGIVATDCNNVTVDNCILRGLGNSGVRISGGTNCGVKNSVIYDMGAMGVSLIGGDRPTLTACNHYAEGNNIYRVSKVLKTYNPCIEVMGVGMKITHNLLHDSTQQAIHITGGGVTVGDKPDFPGSNEITVEYNDMYNLLENQLNDSGFIYSFGDNRQTGMNIRYNFLHHGSWMTQGNLPTAPSGVYMDGGVTGYNVYGNIFYDIPVGCMGNGASFNKIRNNVFVDLFRPVILADETAAPTTYFAKLIQLIQGNKVWLEKYPELAQVLTSETSSIDVEVSRNVVYACDNDITSTRGTFDIQNNFRTSDDVAFKDPVGLDFSFQENSPVFTNINGFEQIPVEQIGLPQ